jgi:hypothetical protein
MLRREKEKLKIFLVRDNYSIPMYPLIVAFVS